MIKEEDVKNDKRTVIRMVKKNGMRDDKERMERRST